MDNFNTHNAAFFSQHSQVSEQQGGDGSTDTAIFCVLPRSIPKDVEEAKKEVEVQEIDEYSRRDRVEEDIALMKQVPLRKIYPRTYSSWKNMKTRCKNGYGEFHPEFREFSGFLAAMGPRPPNGHSLDRKDHNLPDYSPENCRWLSKAGQTANRRNTRYLTDSQGTRRTVAEWSDRWGVPAKLILQRVDRDGWSEDEAIKTPKGCRRPTGKTKPVADSKSLFPESVPSHLLAVYGAWCKAFTDHHWSLYEANIEFLLEWKHIRQLEYIQQALKRCQVEPTEVVTMVVDNWLEFVDDMTSSRYFPTPDIGFLKAHLMAAVEFYFFNGGKQVFNNPPAPTTPTKSPTPVNYETDL